MSGPGYEEGGEAEWSVREVGGPQPVLVIPSLPGGNHTSASGPGFSLVAHPSRSQPIIRLGGIGVTELQRLHLLRPPHTPTKKTIL